MVVKYYSFPPLLMLIVRFVVIYRLGPFLFLKKRQSTLVKASPGKVPAICIKNGLVQPAGFEPAVIRSLGRFSI